MLTVMVPHVLLLSDNGNCQIILYINHQESTGLCIVAVTELTRKATK